VPFLIHLSPHTAESRVDILVVRLEPVSEGPAQHAGRRAWAAALHDVVLAIEEIGRIAGIELKRLKTRKRRELGGGPLPPVAHEVGDPERALALSKGADWRRVPTLEIKVSESAIGRFRSPGIRPLRSL